MMDKTTNSKMDKIRSLKVKLLQMQRGLQKIIEKQQQRYYQHKPSHSQKTEQHNYSEKIQQNNYIQKTFAKTMKIDRGDTAHENQLNYSTLKSPVKERPKNPTFWGTNPILGKENQDRSPGKWKKKSPLRSREVILSPKAGKIMASIDRNYYHQKQSEPNDEKLYQTNPVKIPQRFEFSFHGVQRDTPRFQRIKTYERSERDPILDPEPPRQMGKKITKNQCLSPKDALTENPSSNPLVYFFGEKKVSLSPKSNSINRKNLSPNMRQILARSLQEKKTSPKKSSKKHFQQYFKQTFDSNWR